MIKSSNKFLTITLIFQILLLPISSVNGYQPVIDSRVSKINEITPNISGPYQPNSTLFGIEVEVEILNRDNKSQTVIELTDLNSYAFINASFVNQSLQLDLLSYGAAIIRQYSYKPGITTEYNLMKFYINQSGLTYLPDGNYTLWRPILFINSSGNITEGESLSTIISINDGNMNITYGSFNYQVPIEDDNNLDINDQTTETINSPFTESLLIISLLSCVIVIWRKKTKMK